MRILLLVAMILPAAASAQDAAVIVSPALKPSRCAASPQIAARPQPLRPRKLEDQPRAEQYFTVLRIEDGCDKPVKVREYRRGQR